MTTIQRLKRGLVAVAVAGLLVPLTACESVLEVTDPDTVNPGTLDDPAFIDVLVAGAIGDFAVAYSGPGLNDVILSTTAAMTDEVFSTGTFSTRTATDRRNQFTPDDGNTTDLAYNNLHRARRSLRIAAERVAAHPDKGTGDPDYPELRALQAMTHVTLAENFCSWIPLSDDAGVDPADGPPRTGMELLAEAAPVFADAAGTDLGSVLEARALVNAGDYAAAAALVAGVPTTFAYFIEHSSTDTRENNPIFSLQSNGRYSVSHNEGGNANGLPFRGANPDPDANDPPDDVKEDPTTGGSYNPVGQDPRMPWWEDPAGGFDPAFRLFITLRYPFRDSDMPLATGIEARLIEAEADLAGGGTDWLTILNDLRADVGALMGALVDDYANWVSAPSLPDLVDPGNAADRVDMLFSERAFWLWGTGHRLGDARRLISQYGRTEDEVLPSGAYHKGGDHGNDVAFPVDFDETNNQLYDISQCDVDQAGFN